MSNPLIKKPHIYKKGKILNLKPLDEGINRPAKQYVFSSNSYTIRHITESCNNLNQIVGRNFLGTMSEKDLVLDHLDENQEDFQIEFNESSEGFNGQLLLSQEKLSQINKSSLSLKKESIFKMPALKFLKRKNSIFYYVSTKEMHVDIKDTKKKKF